MGCNSSTDKTVAPHEKGVTLTGPPKTEEEAPKMTQGQWICYHEHWGETEPMKITFENGLKNRFVIGDDPNCTEDDMIGCWKLQPLDKQFELHLLFDSDPQEVRDFHWTGNFDW